MFYIKCTNVITDSIGPSIILRSIVLGILYFCPPSSSRYLVLATPRTVFFPVPLKLYRCLGRGLEMCTSFGYIPQIIFVTFFIFMAVNNRNINSVNLLAILYFFHEFYSCKS